MEWSTLLCSERRRPSTSTADHRAQFERDYDRSIFSNPVKRLQDKTQVFPLDPNDSVRTRLTHSLEVSAVARGIAIGVGKELLKENILKEGQERWLEAIAATCGLIHDLGNPPFGHSGEDAIRDWFSERFDKKELLDKVNKDQQLLQDLLKFEGNAQTLRLVARLQVLADDKGLNLTYGTLSAACKYTAPSHQADKKSSDHALSKPGYFKSESHIIDEIRAKVGTGIARNPITFLVEAADDIVYSAADIEDAIRKGVIQWREVEEDLNACDHDSIAQLLKAKARILEPAGEGVQLPQDIEGSAFRTAAIGVLVHSVVKAFSEQYSDIMRGVFQSELVDACSAAPLLKALKSIGRSRVYRTPSNLRLELMGRAIIWDLMDLFWEGAQLLLEDRSPPTNTFAGKAAALLSQNYKTVFVQTLDEGTLPEQYCAFQLVCDYICGMTDSFAKRLHAELFNG